MAIKIHLMKKNRKKKSLIAILKTEAGRKLPLFYKGLEKPGGKKISSIPVYTKTCKGEMFVSNFYKPISRGIKIINE